jgi:Zn-dependent protease
MKEWYREQWFCKGGVSMDQPKKKRSYRIWGGLGLLLLSFGTKLKVLLPLLKLGKFGGTFISMAVSVGAYALFYPWEVALGLVAMMFIHEMGHVWAAKSKGLEVTAPAFIPFLGALITMKKQPRDAATEAYIAYGGPLIGTLGAFVCYGLGVGLEKKVWIVIAFIGFALNLFNLLPIHPLDGGRIVVAITRWLWGVGLILGLIAIIVLKSILLLFIYLLFVWELWAGWRKGKQTSKEKRFSLEAEVPLSQFLAAGAYIPGEEHRRELWFKQYSSLETKESELEIIYPGVGTILQVNGVKGDVKKVELVRTLPRSNREELIRMTLEGTYLPAEEGGVGSLRQDEKYYTVPLKLRWFYGLAYTGLIFFLLYMLYLIGPIDVYVPDAVS